MQTYTFTIRDSKDSKNVLFRGQVNANRAPSVRQLTKLFPAQAANLYNHYVHIGAAGHYTDLNEYNKPV